ncbi:MAG: hypothetical protein OHK93_000005 [Ramalina farinacea]|uniref:Uncharacterized protein n=1 Tax=Ramalina farinacea TaxID=258253 RepID=A0AA43QHC3_9LECA|nr:hypothetical protein [Ramalina farinacea]
MHSSITISSILMLVLSHFSTALPQPKDIHLIPRVPQYDGAKDGCHPTDFIKGCAVMSNQAPPEEEGEAITKVTDACKATCWPALNGASAASWDPQGDVWDGGFGWNKVIADVLIA